MHKHWFLLLALLMSCPAWAEASSDASTENADDVPAPGAEGASDAWVPLDYPYALAATGATAAAAAALGSSAGMVVGFGSGVFLTDSYTAWEIIAAFAAIGSGVVSALLVALGVAVFAGPERGAIAGVIVGAAVGLMWLVAVAALLNTPTLIGRQLEGAVWVPVVFGGPALLAALIGGFAGLAAVPHHDWWSRGDAGE